MLSFHHRDACNFKISTIVDEERKMKKLNLLALAVAVYALSLSLANSQIVGGKLSLKSHRPVTVQPCEPALPAVTPCEPAETECPAAVPIRERSPLFWRVSGFVKTIRAEIQTRSRAAITNIGSNSPCEPAVEACEPAVELPAESCCQPKQSGIRLFRFNW
jgi:hypothetical protein